MKKNKFKPIIYQDEQHLFRSKPTPEDIVSKLLPLLQNITENKDISCCPKSYKLMKLISYEPSGEEASSPLQCAHLFGGYFACVSEKEGTERYITERRDQAITSCVIAFLYWSNEKTIQKLISSKEKMMNLTTRYGYGIHIMFSAIIAKFTMIMLLQN